jgi:nucleotide-binding universal stress UspA family protein
MTETQQAGGPTTGAAATTTDGSRSRVIVVGYSSKPEGRAALSRALAEARAREAEVVVVHTAPDIEVAALRAELAASGVPYEIKEAADALDPAEELIATADARDAEFIVIGLRKRSPVGKLLLGSNAQRVLLDAACPVLAVKADTV